MLRVFRCASPAVLVCMLVLTACLPEARTSGEDVIIDAPLLSPTNPESVPAPGNYRVDYDTGEMRCAGQTTPEELDYAPPDYVSLEVIGEGETLTVQGWGEPDGPAISFALVDAGTHGTRYFGVQEIAGIRNLYTLLHIIREDGSRDLTGDMTSEGDCEVYRRFTLVTLADDEIPAP
ncbi:MAG: hypothetical protein WBH90_14185 [Aggregatilineales bacterium]|nr:hypothetical protein [Aggregatilineales bacterium]HPV06573.1 hypothetical protein [Aggregatilineales bacterium]